MAHRIGDDPHRVKKRELPWFVDVLVAIAVLVIMLGTAIYIYRNQKMTFQV